MLPYLTRHESLAAGPSSLTVPPPRFRPLTGAPTHVNFRSSPYTPAQGLTVAQKNGLRYEAKAQEHFSGLFGSDYKAGPYIHFLDNRVARTAQPDGVLLLPHSIYIFEIKFQHVPEAWWQLEKLYKPLLTALFQKPVACIEVCRSFDPSTPFPVKTTGIVDLCEWVARERNEFGVLLWRP